MKQGDNILVDDNTYEVKTVEEVLRRQYPYWNSELHKVKVIAKREMKGNGVREAMK